jgi:succinate dehydrogenase / fumarate reductase cytochrome b subunit
MALFQFFRSTVGLKMLMALSGLILFGFVFGHMAGNLQIFLGSDQLNGYAYFLKSTPELLWPVRILLLLAVITHIVAGYGLWLHNKAARPVDYSRNAATKASLSSRTMIYSGTIVLVFIIFHLLQFTVMAIDSDYASYVDAQNHHDVYRMVITAFGSPWIAWFYVISVGLLCYHMSHGVASFFRSLGFTNAAYLPLQVWFARAFSTVVFLGMVIIPLAVQFGFLKLPDQS